MGLYRRKDSPYWWFKFMRNNRAIVRSTETVDRKLAQKIYEKTLGEHVSEQHGFIAPSITLQELLDKWCAYARTNKKGFKQDQSLANIINASFGPLRASELTQEKLELFRASKKQIVSETTINRYCALLRAAYNAGIRWGLVKENPVKGIRFYNEAHKHRVRYLTDEERKRLLEHCTPRLLPIVLVALRTGMRQGEILSLRWSQIDFNKKLITLRITKSGKPRHVPMDDDILSLLQSRKNDQISATPEDLVFDSDNRNSYRTGWEGVIKRAGIEDFHFHDLRHDFASQLVMKGVDLYTVAKLLGHTTTAMTQRYAHLSPEFQRKAIEMLPSYRYADVTDDKKPKLKIV